MIATVTIPETITEVVKGESILTITKGTIINKKSVGNEGVVTVVVIIKNNAVVVSHMIEGEDKINRNLPMKSRVMVDTSRVLITIDITEKTPVMMVASEKGILRPIQLRKVKEMYHNLMHDTIKKRTTEQLDMKWKNGLKKKLFQGRDQNRPVGRTRGIKKNPRELPEKRKMNTLAAAIKNMQEISTPAKQLQGMQI